MFPWVYTEFLFVPVYQEQANFHDVATHLGVHGYCLFDFCGKRATEMGRCDFSTIREMRSGQALIKKHLLLAPSQRMLISSSMAFA
jgi:hypothetical protein